MSVGVNEIGAAMTTGLLKVFVHPLKSVIVKVTL